MVANDPSVSPGSCSSGSCSSGSCSSGSWMPMSRVLSAVFAGSAVMFGTALLQGGSLLSHEEVRPAAEPMAGRTEHPPVMVTEKIPAGDAAPAAPIVAPNQAAPWTPGATPDWGGSLRDLPVERAPVRSAPQREAPAPAPPADAGEDPEPARDESVRPTDDDPDRGTLGDVLDYIGP